MRSFIVLALSAAYSAAQLVYECKSEENDFFDDTTGGDDGNNDFDVVTITDINDTLCYARSDDPQDKKTWWDIDREIQREHDKITQIRNDVKKAVDCEQRNLTSWKKDYPFTCPQTQPDFQDWQGFLPAADAYNLFSQAKSAREEASRLRGRASSIRSTITSLDSQINSATQKIASRQASIDEVEDFKSYYDSNGSNYTSVNDFYVQQFKDFDAAIKAAKADYDSTTTDFNAKKKAYDNQVKKVTTEQGKLDAAVVKYQRDVLKKAYDAAVSAARKESTAAKKLYDDSFNLATKAVKDANTQFTNATRGFKISSLQKTYDTEFAKATSTAQKNFNTAQSNWQREQDKVDIAQANLNAATDAANSIGDLQSCFEQTSVNLWASQDARSTDEEIFQTAVDNAQNAIKNAQIQSKDIEKLQKALDAAIVKRDAEQVKLDQRQTELSEAETKRDAADSKTQKAKDAWDAEQARYDSDTAISLAVAALEQAQFELDSGENKSLFDSWQLAIDAETNGSDVLSTKNEWENPVASSLDNYSTLQGAIDAAQEILAPLESAYLEIKSTRDDFALTQQAAQNAKNAIDKSYYDAQLKIQKSYQDKLTAWDTKIEKDAASLIKNYKLPSNASQTIISALEKWVKGKASSSASSSLISTLSKQSNYELIAYAIQSLDSMTANEFGTTITAADWNQYKSQLDADVFTKIIESSCKTQETQWDKDEIKNEKDKQTAITKYEKEVTASLSKLEDTTKTDSISGIVTVTKQGYRNLLTTYKDAYDVAELYYQNMLDPNKYRTQLSAEILTKQPELEAARETALSALTTLLDPEGTGNVKINEDHCTIRSTNCTVSANAPEDFAKTAALEATTARNIIQEEVDALEKLVYKLSRTSEITKEQKSSKTARDQAFTKYDNHIKTLDLEEKKLGTAQQNLEAQRDESALQSLQSDWLAKLSPPRDTASSECTIQTDLQFSYDSQIADIQQIVSDLTTQRNEVDITLKNLKKAGCENTIFYRERINELSAQINRFNQQMAEAQAPLQNDTVLDQLDINYGLEKLSSDAAAAAFTACALEVQLTNEMKPWTENIKFEDWSVNRNPTGWCAVSSWSSSSYDTSKYEPSCAGNKDKLSFEAEVQTLLDDRYSSSTRQAFLGCTGKSISEPNFGDDWETRARGTLNYDLGEAQCDLGKFESQRSPLIGQPDQLDSEADALIQQASDWELRYEQEITNNFKGKTAQEIKDCNTDRIADWESQIPDIELKIIELTVFRATKYSSFYSDYRDELDNEKQQLLADKKRADDNFRKTNSNLFQTRSFGTPVKIDIPVTTARLLSLAQEEVVSEDELRQLATYNTSDLDMISFIPFDVQPSGVKLCTGLTYSIDPVTKVSYANPDLAGLQVFFGEGDKQVYGPAHGNLENGCVDSQFEGKRPNVIKLYEASNKKLQGIRIEFRVAGQYEPEFIERGIVEQPGQSVYTTEFDSNDKYQFFGFEARTDDKVPSLVNSSVKPVVYDPVLFSELKQIIDTYDQNFEVNKENLASVGLTVANWDQERIYNKVIESDVISQVPQATSTPKAIEVLRPEQAAILKSQLSGSSSGGHINEEDDQDTGAIVATIIGGILMLLLTATLIYKCMAKRTFNGFGGKSQATPGRRDNRILVNQSAASDGTRVVAADDIC